LKHNVDSLWQTGPDVILIDIVGDIDTDTSKLTASELMMWGLANLWKEGREGGYFVWHGKQPVNDFGHPRAGDDPCPAKRLNFFARAFPGLFPYGEGGIVLRPCPTPGLIQLLWLHRSSIAQLQSHITYSGHGRADIPLLSTTLGLIPIQSLLHLAIYPALT